MTPSLTSVVKRALPPSVVQRIRRERWLLAYFLRKEMSSPVRLAAPGLVLRGYQSDRRWLYPTRPSRAAGYLDDYSYWRLAPRINPPAVRALFLDKAGFDCALHEHGFGDAAPQVLATVTGGEVARRREWSGPVALKPVDGSGGKGFALFDSLDEALAAAPATGSHLVQEKVVGHSYGVELFPGSLNTLRVFALRDAPGEPSRVPVAVQRIGTEATAPLDSFSAGGLLARVDLATGELSQAVGPVVRRARDTHDHHPDTGARITGRVVPQLDEALDLVRRLMDAFPEALHVGWDIAVSDRGPVVVEGNATQPAFRSAQAHGPFADHPSVRDFYVRHGFLPRRAAA